MQNRIRGKIRKIPTFRVEKLQIKRKLSLTKEEDYSNESQRPTAVVTVGVPRREKCECSRKKRGRKTKNLNNNFLFSSDIQSTSLQP